MAFESDTFCTKLSNEKITLEKKIKELKETHVLEMVYKSIKFFYKLFKSYL